MQKIQSEPGHNVQVVGSTLYIKLTTDVATSKNRQRSRNYNFSCRKVETHAQMSLK